MSILKELAAVQARGGSAALCTIIKSSGSTPRHIGSKMIVYPDGQTQGSVGGGEMESRVIEQALQVLQTGKPCLLEYSLTDPQRGDPGVCGGQLEVFVEPVTPLPTVVVVGAGHVGRAVVHLAKWLGYHVIVSDDRPEFCSPQAAPGADQYLPVPLSELPQQINITPQTHLVLSTRNMKVDIDGLPALLETPAGYIGIIGSHRRWQTARKKLEKAGVPAAKLNRVASPMGLELNAETPEEIALSILAEIVMLRNGGDGERMRG
ncbi:MAG: XdhC family protein [Anaerolineae bacterium]|nr:XdhC family protein [Anaerolineae bacterium]